MTKPAEQKVPLLLLRCPIRRRRRNARLRREMAERGETIKIVRVDNAVTIEKPRRLRLPVFLTKHKSAGPR